MRLFIAIQLSESMRDAVRRVQDQFTRYGVTGNYIPRENLHLTLAFIGEYPEPEDVLDVIESLPMPCFEIATDGVGAFDDLWWVGIWPSEPLAAYVRALRHALANAGIPFDSKRFTPHITFLRGALCGPIGMPGVAIPQAGMSVKHVSLMRSDRGKAGVSYTELL